MIEEKIKNLKKLIIYRSSYTGTKETDLLFNKIIIANIEKLNFTELNDLKNLFNDYSDQEIFFMITNNKFSNRKYKKIFKKLQS